MQMNMFVNRIEVLLLKNFSNILVNNDAINSVALKIIKSKYTLDCMCSIKTKFIIYPVA